MLHRKGERRIKKNHEQEFHKFRRQLGDLPNGIYWIFFLINAVRFNKGKLKLFEWEGK